MADVFISYSRKNKAFAQQLNDALESKGLQAWVDWEGIAPSAEWMAEIYSAIDAAAAFIFVISPDSVASEVCGKELTYAVQQNKRIIPIVCAEAPAAAVPPELARLNWIFFRETDAFAEAVDTLVEAVNTDLDWVRAHTRLLVRSREWETNAKNPSFLLRGVDLKQAEAWLSTAQGKEPRPTPLHTRYVIRSREATTRRQRITTSGIAAGFIVAVVLAVIAVIQRNVAVEQAKISTSRELSATAVAQLAVDPERSLLLAVDAVGIMPTVQAEDALRQGLLASHIHVRLEGHRQRVNSAHFSPDGRWVVTASDDGTAGLWTSETGLLRTSLEGHRGRVTGAVFSPDGAAVATGSDSGEVWIWNTAGGQRRQVIPKQTGPVICLAFAPGSDRIAVGGSDGTVRIIDLGSLSEIVIRAPRASRIQSVAFHPEGRKLLAAVGNSAVIWDVASGEVLKQWQGHTRNMYEAAFSGDGQQVVTTGGDKAVRIWRWQAPGAPTATLNHAGMVFSAAFHPDGRWVVSACGAPSYSAQIWDAVSGRKILPLLGHTGAITTVAFSPDGLQVLTASDDGTARVWDVGLVSLGDGLKGMNSAAFSPDGAVVATADRRGTVSLWDARTGRHLKDLEHRFTWLNSISFSPDGSTVIGAGRRLDSGHCASTWDVGDGQWLLDFRGHTRAVSSAVFSPDGEHVLTASEDLTARVWDAGSGKQRRVLTGHTDRLKSAVFSADGTRIVTASLDGTARVWNASTGDFQRLIGDHDQGLNHAAFSPDGKRIVTAGLDRIARIWDADSSELIASLEGHTDVIWNAAFSGDGAWVVTGGDETARLWNAGTGRCIAVLRGHQGRVYSASFDPAASRVVTASDDGTARIYPAEICRPLDALVAMVPNRVTRQLTTEERQIFLHEQKTPTRND